MKPNRIIKISFLSALFFLSINVFSDTIYCCQTDTLKLAYNFEDSLYNEGCDIQIDDIVIMNSSDNIFVEIEPAVSYFDFNLGKRLNPLCEWISCEFENNITEISIDGEYSGSHPDYDYLTSFRVIRGEENEIENLFISPGNVESPQYSLKIKNDFKNYIWSNGSISNSIIVDEPGNYTIHAENHCNEVFENTITFFESDFEAGQFYAGKIEGENIIHVDLNPDTAVHFSHGGPQGSKYLEFDINNNGSNDLKFYVHFSSAMGAWGWALRVTPLNGSQIIIDEHYRVAARLNDGQMINNVISYSDSANTILYHESGGMYSGCICGNWQYSDHFLGFYIPTVSDTLYGWMNIAFSADWNNLDLVIDEYAYVATSLNGINQNYTDQISVYPNPFSINLKINTQVQDYSIKLLDVFGKGVFSQDKINGSKNVNLQSLPSGIYFLVIESGTFRQIQKVIKQ